MHVLDGVDGTSSEAGVGVIPNRLEGVRHHVVAVASIIDDHIEGPMLCADFSQKVAVELRADFDPDALARGLGALGHWVDVHSRVAKCLAKVLPPCTC